MQVDVLGPLQITPVDTPGTLMTKERAVLEVLALHTPVAVSRATLARGLWGDLPPATAHRTLASHVSRLRHCLGHDLVAADLGGYRLTLPPESVDVFRLEALVKAGADALDRAAPAEARLHFSAAEALWRGEPLPDLAESVDRQAQVDRLHRLAEEARHGRLRSELDLGRHEEVLPELERLSCEHPLVEPLCSLLMLALYRAGRQVDALRAYRRLRVGLAEEWGVDPDPELQRLQWRVLRQDPQLDVHPPAPPLVAPAAWASIVGRDADVAELAALVPASRLVTLRGPAGVGKSRLGLEVARTVQPRFADGVWWVDLTVAGQGNAAIIEVARTLGAVVPPGGSISDALARHLARRQLLLVLDNCEHLVAEVAPLVVALLPAAPALSILATSRVDLCVSGEVSWTVRPLDLPSGTAPDMIAGSPAVQLFLARRAASVAPEEDDQLREIGRLCRRLDGRPLALELMAAQARHVAVSTINERLDTERQADAGPLPGTELLSDPELLPGTELLDTAFRAARSPHHTSLRAAVERSYQMLEPSDQRALEWLSVFRGPFDRHTAERLLGAMSRPDPDQRGCLTRLAEASLLEARPHDCLTYRQLFVMRQHAAAHLESRGETAAAHQALTDAMRSLAVEAGPHLDGPQPGRWLSRLQADLPNLRAAVRWSIDHEPPARTLDFARSIGRILWGASLDLQADVVLLRRILGHCEAAPADAAGWGWQALVTASYLVGDLPLALHACDRAEALFTQAGDSVGLAVVCWHRGAAQLLAAGDLAAAETALRRGRALARSAGAATPEAWNLAHLVQLLYLRGEATDETDSLTARAEALADPQDGQLQCHLAMNRAFVALVRGDLGGTVGLARQAEADGRRHGIPAYEQASMLARGLALLESGETDAARATALGAAQLALDTSNAMQLGLALQQLAALSDHPAVAARLWGAAEARAALFPAFAGSLGLDGARQVLGDEFAALAAAGRLLSSHDALDLAVG